MSVLGGWLDWGFCSVRLIISDYKFIYFNTYPNFDSGVVNPLIDKFLNCFTNLRR